MNLVVIVARESEIPFPEKLKTLTILKSNITSVEDAALFAQEVSNISFDLKWIELD